MLLTASEGRSTLGGLCACALIPGVTAPHRIATSANTAKIFKQPLLFIRTKLFVMEPSPGDFAMPHQNAQNVDAPEFCRIFHFPAAHSRFCSCVIASSRRDDGGAAQSILQTLVLYRRL